MISFVAKALASFRVKGLSAHMVTYYSSKVHIIVSKYLDLACNRILTWPTMVAWFLMVKAQEKYRVKFNFLKLLMLHLQPSRIMLFLDLGLFKYSK